MLKGFEDAFVDAQANVISLCLELLKNSEKSADVIYVYILQNDNEEYIDAFFEKDGKLFTTNDWCSDAQIKEFFHCGIEDIESIVELCDTYDAKCPHEFKLVYNVNSKSFDSNYNYENVTDVYDKDVIELVEDKIMVEVNEQLAEVISNSQIAFLNGTLQEAFSLYSTLICSKQRIYRSRKSSCW